jgi:hypothetical protein
MLFDRLKNLDTKLIEKVFEPVAWRIEYEWKINNFACARAVLVLWPVCMVTAIIFFDLNTLGWALIAAVVAVASLMYWVDVLEEKVAGKQGLSFSRWDWKHRISIMLPLLPICFISVSNHPWWGKWFAFAYLGYLTHLYFKACRPMPLEWKQARDKKKAKNLVFGASRS